MLALSELDMMASSECGSSLKTLAARAPWPARELGCWQQHRNSWGLRGVISLAAVLATSEFEMSYIAVAISYPANYVVLHRLTRKQT
jgi:hypothetical protein